MIENINTTRKTGKNWLKMDKKPKIGVGVIVIKENKVLLGKRKGSHGEGEYAFPGGHLEYMETIEDCARRETLEETGIKIKNIRFQFLANVHKYKNHASLRSAEP